jgi:hypothetical protein
MSLVKLSNNGVKNITSVGNVGTGDLVFISKQTANSSASISFTSGIDSTYKEYIFFLVNVHPQNTDQNFGINFSTDGGSNYNVTKTGTFFRAYHGESDSPATLEFDAGVDLAQSTSFQPLGFYIGNNNDDNLNGTLQIFNPSSNTFVKHFISTTSFNHIPADAREMNSYIAGYGNTTSAINAIQFKMSSGNIDAGDILLYGVN